MKMRPADSDGDILPVLHTGEMFSRALAVASLVESRLELYAGDWWENPSWGNEILRMLQEGRLTNADAQALSTYLTEYVRETSGVQDAVRRTQSESVRRAALTCAWAGRSTSSSRPASCCRAKRRIGWRRRLPSCCGGPSSIRAKPCRRSCDRRCGGGR